MDSQILSQAKKDIPLYFKDFKSFWDSTTLTYSDIDLTNCYATTTIFKNWKICLNHVMINELNDLLNEISEDTIASFFHSYFGNYRSSHMHLRSMIELSLQLIYFYQHDVEYDLWKKGEFRIKHEQLITYLKKHPLLKNAECNNLLDSISKYWVIFSKYIHAEAPIYFQTTLTSQKTKKISKKDFGIWKSNYLKATYQINRLLLYFFKNNINSFPSHNRNLLLRKLSVKHLGELGIAPLF